MSMIMLSKLDSYYSWPGAAHSNGYRYPAHQKAIFNGWIPDNSMGYLNCCYIYTLKIFFFLNFYKWSKIENKDTAVLLRPRCIYCCLYVSHNISHLFL